MTTEQAAQTVQITINGTEVEVPAGELLIKAAEDAGTYIPRFCWHSRMKPVGMCRQCLVEVEGPRGTMLTTSCTMTVNDGMVVNTESDTVKKAQEGILEFLLINHPLDCPVCDRGGECPLQDQTMAYGPGESRFVEEKRHYEKPIPISELVMLDRERCILCARCTRFSDEISGDPLIEFKERGNNTQVLTFPDEPFRSYFSGNTVQICPVGALTAKPYRFRARPWDLEAVESTCPHCSVGCRISVESSQNQVLRFNGVDNDPTNQGWLCDKGRFGFEYINSTERLETPLIRGEDGELHEASWSEAIDAVADRLGGFKGDEVAGIGGSRNTNEEAYAFGKFLRSVVVTPHIDAQLGDGLAPEFIGGVYPRATIDDLERAKTILLWGPDLKEELPVLYLRVRRAAAELGANLIVIHPRNTGLDDVASHTVRYRPGTGADLIERLVAGTGELADVREALNVGPVVALVGRPGLAEDIRLPEAVAAFARDLPEATVLPLVRRPNVFGALAMGLAPNLLPGPAEITDADARSRLEEAWGPLPETDGLDATGILEGLASAELGALVLLGADPVADHVDPVLAAEAIGEAGFVVAIDQFLNDSSRLADVVLPAEGFAESEGTVTNVEGRVQKVNRLIPGPGQSRPVWAILDDLARRMGGELGAPSAAALAKEILTLVPSFSAVGWDELDWGSGREGILIEPPLRYLPVAAGITQHAQSGFSLHLAHTLYSDGTLTGSVPAFAGLAPEASVHLNPGDAARLGINGGDLVRVTGDAAVELPAVIDDGLVEGTVYVPAGRREARALGSTLAVAVAKGTVRQLSLEGGGS
ncbi:MAG: NADH-quinone oxidoreductase subunit NuoG [Acidimicrobiia bacterium]|nr:NADH-quinone oxidoreductase subunit NuoG [Acidimicrobiia bacterium]